MQTDTRPGTSRTHFGAAQKSCDRTARVVKDLNLPIVKGKFQTRLEPSKSEVEAGKNSHAGRKTNNYRALNA